MISKINYYILIPKGEWERFHKNLNKAMVTCLISIKELENAFGRVAKILRNDKFYKVVCEANKYTEEHKGD